MEPPDSPAKSSFSVTEEWGLSTPRREPGSVLSTPGKGATAEELRDIVLESACRALDLHGTPLKYLWNRFNTPEKRAAQATMLYHLFPPTEAHPLPGGPDLEVGSTCTCHIAMFSINPDHCPREPSNVCVVKQIVDSIMTDGFTSLNEPLLICTGGTDELKKRGQEAVGDSEFPWVGHSVIPPMSIGHHKSAGRIASLLLIVQLFVDDQVDMKEALPKLYYSVLEIWCVNKEFVTKRGQLIHNLKASEAGALRRRPNVLSWVIGLRRLIQVGDTDEAAVVREYNASCMAGSKLVGGKAQAVRNILLNCNEEALDLLTTCVSELGWDGCPFSEDGLGSKKIWSGKSWHGPSKRWTALTEVTDESITLCLEHIIIAHKRFPEGCRRKRSRVDMEARAQVAAIVVNVAREFVSTSPVTKDAVWKEFVEEWKAGNPRVEMELQCAMAERSDAFKPHNLQVLTNLLQAHRGGQTFDLVEGERAVARTGATLDAERFAYLLKQLEYDEQAFKVYQAKLSDAAKSIYGVKQEWNLKRYRQSQKAAEEWLESRARIKYTPDMNGFAAVYMKEVSHLSQKYNMPQDQVVTLAVVNWVSPSMLSNQDLEQQANIIHMLVNGSSHNIVPILFPQWTYKKGQLYLVEQMVHNMLAHRTINVDAKFGLVFEECAL